MTEKQFKIAFQAVDENLTKSTGDYDDFIEYGMVSSTLLKELLTKFASVELLVINDSNMDEDLCPANMIVDTDTDTICFIPSDNKKLYCDKTNSDLDIDTSYGLLVGEISEEELLPEVTQEQTDSMVRMSHVRPTLENLQASQISTNLSVPQIEHIVWKDKWWSDTKLSTIIFGVLMVLITFMIPKEEAQSAAITMGLAVILFALSFVFSKFGKTTFRLGLDWDTNTLWVYHGKDFNWITNANQILELTIEKRDQENGVDVATSVMTDGAITGAGKERTWILKAIKESSRPLIVAEFSTKKEATEVLEKAQALLNSFK